METIKECELCGDKNFVTVVEAHDYLVTGETFNISRCLRCDFVFTNPRPSPENIGKYYQSPQYISHTNSSQTTFDKVYQVVRRYMLQKKIALLQSFFPSGKPTKRLLDYGCATGEFLSVATKNGFEVAGFEPDANAREKAREKGIEVFDNINTIAARKDYPKFDVISLWHVLEHIPDLNHQINLLSGMLSPNGLIVVAVPEYNSYDGRFYSSDWAAWDVPRHLNHFEEKTIRSLFAKHGFMLQKKKPLLFDSFYVSMLSEKSKKKGLAGMVRAAGIGLISNLKYYQGSNPCSSQIYIFKKDKL